MRFLVLLPLLAGCATVPPAATVPMAVPNAPALARLWDAERVSSPLSPLVDHVEVKSRVLELQRSGGALFRVQEVGRSVEGREIYSVSFGEGPFIVMMWSQMHGDEPTATSALFDVYEYIRRHQQTPSVARLLRALTVHTVPMLNPDGAELFQRRNAQNLDINRDALDLVSPEARLLKSLRDRWQAQVGYNLHNQNWRTQVGEPGRGAAISLLSVAYDEARSMNDGRLLTKKLGAVIRDSLEPFALGRIGRYDDTFEPRAFGDQLTLAGTPVLLIETGPWPDPEPDPMLIRLNYIALIRSLHALASGSVHAADPARYDSLPENRGGGFHTRFIGAKVVRTEGGPAETADVGVAGVRRVRFVEGRRVAVLELTVAGIGDLGQSATLFAINAFDRIVAPLREGANEGDEIVMSPGQLVLRSGPNVPANLMMLAPLGPARYRVDRVLRADTVLGAK